MLEQAFHRIKPQPVQQFNYIGVINRRRISGLPPIFVHGLRSRLPVYKRLGAAYTAARAAHSFKEIGVRFSFAQRGQHFFTCRDAIRLLRAHRDFPVGVQPVHSCLYGFAHPALPRINPSGPR